MSAQRRSAVAPFVVLGDGFGSFVTRQFAAREVAAVGLDSSVANGSKIRRAPALTIRTRGSPPVPSIGRRECPPTRKAYVGFGEGTQHHSSAGLTNCPLGKKDLEVMLRRGKKVIQLIIPRAGY